MDKTDTNATPLTDRRQSTDKTNNNKSKNKYNFFSVSNHSEISMFDMGYCRKLSIVNINMTITNYRKIFLNLIEISNLFTIKTV